VKAWTLLALAALSLAGCKYDRDDYKTPTDPGGQFLQATAAVSSLPGDGISTVELTARISPNAAERTIKFTASLGTLVGGSGAPSSLQVTADSAGVARAVLKSSKDLGTSLVTVEVVNATIAAQTMQIAFVAPDPGSILRFVSVPANVLADGTTATPITVAVAAGLPGGDARKVTLTTALGSFNPVSAAPSLDVTPSPVDNTATVLLYSPQQVGLSTLSAKVGEVQRTTVLSFDRALPDSIRVDLDKLRVPNTAEAGGNLTVTAFLTRQTGKVSLDTRVIFEALVGGASVGRFVSQDNLSDAEGQVTAVFSPAGTVTPGRVTMRVRVEGGVSGSAGFEVTPP
jgi:hypothetical protein